MDATIVQQQAHSLLGEVIAVCGPILAGRHGSAVMSRRTAGTGLTIAFPPEPNQSPAVARLLKLVRSTWLPNNITKIRGELTGKLLPDEVSGTYVLMLRDVQGLVVERTGQ